MKYDVTFTEQAENDLRGIFEYIAFDLLSPENAAGQLDRIEEKILSLGEYPEKFRQYEREPWKSRNTRVVPVDNYVIFYIPDKTKKLVTVFGTISAVICTYMMSLKFQRFLYARKVTILSETDLLTGLFNRNSYERKLKVYSSMCNQVFACIYVDVNGLHEINNTKGHVAG